MSTFLGMVAYAGPMGNVATLTHELGATPAGSTWILASMSVGLAVTLLMAGVIADELGHRQVFRIGAALFAVANLASAFADDVAVFVIARILAGAGATGMIATGLGLIATVSLHEHQRSRTATWWSAAMGFGIALGPILTGSLDLVGAWRGFYIALAVAGLAVLALTRRLPARGAGYAVPRRLDIVGFVLLTTFLATLVTAIVQVRARASHASSLMFAVAGVSLVALVVSQRFSRARLIEPHLFAQPRFLGATVAAFGAGMGVISVMSFAGTFLVLGRGATTLEVGLLLATWSGTSAVAALVLARLGSAISGPVALMGGLTGVGLGLLLLAWLAEDSGLRAMLPGLLVAGVSSGLLNTGLAREAVASVPPANAAMGTGATNTARYIGAAIGVTVASVVAATQVTATLGWNLVALLGAAASLLAAIVVAFLSSFGTAAGRSTLETAPGP